METKWDKDNANISHLAGFQVRGPWRNRPIGLIGHTLITSETCHLSSFNPMQKILKRRHLVARRNMGCFQGLAILFVVCTVIICALQTLYFFLLKRNKNVPSSRMNCEDLNEHNREPGNTREINIQWPHLSPRKQPIEHSEQPFNQVGFMIIT